MAEPIIEKTIALTRSLRNVATQVMEQAHKARDAGELPLPDFLAVAERYQEMINEANRAIHDAAARLPSLTDDFSAIEDATRTLEADAVLLKQVTDVLTVAAKLLVAMASLATLIAHPDPSGVATTAAAVYDAARAIRDQANSR